MSIVMTDSQVFRQRTYKQSSVRTADHMARKYRKLAELTPTAPLNSRTVLPLILAIKLCFFYYIICHIVNCIFVKISYELSSTINNVKYHV